MDPFHTIRDIYCQDLLNLGEGRSTNIVQIYKYRNTNTKLLNTAKTLMHIKYTV